MTTTIDPWQIHRLLAEETDKRLQLMRNAPNCITLMGADADISRRLLAKRYPKAKFTEYDPRADFLAIAHKKRQYKIFWHQLTGKAIAQFQQALHQPLPPATADMLWANLSLMTTNEPTVVFDNWSRHLKTDGLLFFTHFGIDSLNDLLKQLIKQGINLKAPMLFDMHDLGDMLFHHGFYDPVMDTAKLQLNYQNAGTFWQDMQILGLWNGLYFDDRAAAEEYINQLFQNNNTVAITLETIYGHALKKPILPNGEKPIQFFNRRD